MELALSAAALGAQVSGFGVAELLLRCVLQARYAPRVAVALTSVAAMSAALGRLIARGGWRAIPTAVRAPVLAGAWVGGTLGRALLLMFVARVSGSLALARLHAPLLCVLSLCAVWPAWHARSLPSARATGALCVLCGAVDGFCGAGGAALLGHALPAARRPPSGAALALTLAGQAGALALTLGAGAAIAFPARALIVLALSAGIGGAIAERATQGGVPGSVRLALRVLLLLLCCAQVEQALRG